MSNRSAFYVEYVSIPLCRSAFGYRSYLKCFSVTTANYPPRKTSSRSAFNVEQVSILCRIREHSIVQVSIRIPIISLCRSAIDQTLNVSMLLPPITLLGKHQAGQHLTSNRSAFHIPLRQRFAVQTQRSIRSLSLSPLSLSLSLINNYIHAYMCLTVGRQSRDLRPLSRDRSETFFKFFSECLKRPKNVVWQSADGRVTSATVAWPFSDFFQNFRKSLDTSRKRCLTVYRRSRDLRLLSRDRSVTFFKNFPNCLKLPKNVVWQSADGRVTSTTVAWPFSDFLQNFPKSLETSKKRCLTVGRRSLDLNHCRVTVQRLFSKFSQIAWNVQKTLFDSRPTVAWPPTTVAWPFCDFSQNFF